MDKLTEVYTLKIPESLKIMIDKLTPDYKIKLNYEIRILMARIVHESRFKPEDYLGE